VLIGSFRTYPVLDDHRDDRCDFRPPFTCSGRFNGFSSIRLISARIEHLPDLNKRELALLVPLIAAIIWLGVYPAPVLRRMQGSASFLSTASNVRGSLTAVSEGALMQFDLSMPATHLRLGPTCC